MTCIIAVLFVGTLATILSAEYIPGTPGAVWTKEETQLVRKKVLELVRYANWSPDTKDGLFWRDGTLSGSGALSGTEQKWCEDCPWGKTDVDKNQLPSTAKLLRLAFHDCTPYIGDDGSRYGGTYTMMYIS